MYFKMSCENNSCTLANKTIHESTVHQSTFAWWISYVGVREKGVESIYTRIARPEI